MNFIPIIGLEIHVQLLTDSKMFCSCSTKFGSPANTQTCPVCLGFPGVLPVANERGLALGFKSSLALNCKISETIKFDRKNYFYPDLPKAYQISQYDRPIAKGGSLCIMSGEGEELKKIRIRRVHLEEDAGKLIHVDGKHSLVDFNRAGIPLMEIVTEPDINSPQEAYSFLDKLKTLLKYLEVSDCNMDEGSLRCDANVSIQVDNKEGVKAEVKNMNSFKGVKNALQYEINRQIEEIKVGNLLKQDTRLWDESKKITVSMRSKEEAHDYRYFPEPDLVLFTISRDDIDKITSSLPELPDEKEKRFIKEYNLSGYDAGVITSDKALADFFESCCRFIDDYKFLSNWITQQVLEILNEKNITIKELGISSEDFCELLNLVKQSKINASTAKKVFISMIDSGKIASIIVEEEGLLQISDTSELEKIVKETISENKKSVDDYNKGKKNAIMYLVGQVMRKTKGKANPKVVNEALEKFLKNK